MHWMSIMHYALIASRHAGPGSSDIADAFVRWMTKKLNSYLSWATFPPPLRANVAWMPQPIFLWPDAWVGAPIGTATPQPQAIYITLQYYVHRRGAGARITMIECRNSYFRYYSSAWADLSQHFIIPQPHNTLNKTKNTGPRVQHMDQRESRKNRQMSSVNAHFKGLLRRSAKV
jgi:hypothetical protein